MPFPPLEVGHHYKVHILDELTEATLVGKFKGYNWDSSIEYVPPVLIFDFGEIRGYSEGSVTFTDCT